MNNVKRIMYSCGSVTFNMTLRQKKEKNSGIQKYMILIILDGKST